LRCGRQFQSGRRGERLRDEEPSPQKAFACCRPAAAAAAAAVAEEPGPQKAFTWRHAAAAAAAAAAAVPEDLPREELTQGALSIRKPW